METQTNIEKLVESHTATVGDLIKHLQEHFKPSDKLCFWYEGGAYMNCEHLPKSDLGDLMFKYVKDDKKRRIEDNGDTQEQVDKDFEFVSDNDVIIY